MFSSRPRTAAEEELMEARLDGYNQRQKKGKNDDARESDDDTKPSRRPRKSADETAKAGRWVAPTILVLTILIAAIFWVFQ